MLYCLPVRTIVQLCIIRACHLSPSGRRRISALHKEPPATIFKILFLFGSKKKGTDFSTELLVLVCQIVSPKCLLGMGLMAMCNIKLRCKILFCLILYSHIYICVFQNDKLERVHDLPDIISDYFKTKRYAICFQYTIYMNP